MNRTLIILPLLKNTIMNRTEFFNLLAAAKEKSGKSTNTVSFDLRMQWSTLRRFEKGGNNSNMKKIFDYLQVINAYIQIGKVIIFNYENLLAWLIDARKEHSLSQRALAKEIECAPSTIANIEREETIISIDTFLKIVDVLGYVIKIENNEHSNTSSEH